MTDSQQVELVKQRMAKLELQQAEVQKKLDSAEGFFGRWRLSSQQFESLNEQRKLLFQKIKETDDELIQLYAPAPPPPPPPTKWQTLKGFRGNIEFLLFVEAVILGSGAAFFTSWRRWAILRMRYAPYSKEEWYWRRELLQVESPFPPAVKKIMIFSTACIVW